MKDGTTHLAYKAEYVVDLESGMILGTESTRKNIANELYRGAQATSEQIALED